MRDHQIKAEISERIDEHVSRWAREKYGKPLANLLNEPEEKYQELETSLLNDTREAIQEHMATWASTGYQLIARGSKFCFVNKNTRAFN